MVLVQCLALAHSLIKERQADLPGTCLLYTSLESDPEDYRAKRYGQTQYGFFFA